MKYNINSYAVKVMFYIWLLIHAALAYDDFLYSNANKVKRQVAGALHIMTNNAEPIHADVRTEAGTDITEKPCPKTNIVPSHVESGVVFQVTPPEETMFEPHSLRKSLNFNPTHLDLIRSGSRLTTLLVLVVAAVVEFYPIIKTAVLVAYKFIYL